MEVVIIRLTPYREKDYIVNAFSSEGPLSFRAPGALSLKSKFAGKLFLFALVDIELTTTKSGATVTNVISLNNAPNILSNPRKVVALGFIGEVLNKTLKDDASISETFALIKEVLIGLGKTSHLLSLLYTFLTVLLRELGVGLVIDRCVVTGQTNDIVGVDLTLGGLVSRAGYQKTSLSLSEEEIKMLRYGFMINTEQLLRHEFSDNTISKLFRLMVSYLETTYNFKILTIDLLF